MLYEVITMENLTRADPDTHRVICDSFHHWDDIEVHFRGRVIRSGGHGFSGIGRMRLLEILAARCTELGVHLEYQRDVADEREIAKALDADLILACDVITSYSIHYTKLYDLSGGAGTVRQPQPVDLHAAHHLPNRRRQTRWQAGPDQRGRDGGA